MDKTFMIMSNILDCSMSQAPNRWSRPALIIGYISIHTLLYTYLLYVLYCLMHHRHKTTSSCLLGGRLAFLLRRRRTTSRLFGSRLAFLLLLLLMSHSNFSLGRNLVDLSARCFATWSCWDRFVMRLLTCRFSHSMLCRLRCLPYRATGNENSQKLSK